MTQVDQPELTQVPSHEEQGTGTKLVVGVVGAGTMGTGIAQLALAAGHELILHDVDEVAIGRARLRIEEGLTRLAAKGRLQSGPAEALARLRTAQDLGALGGEADIVVEAALEELELKRRIFGALDSAAAPSTVLATNTSALSVGAIAEGALRHPERVVGLHFFNPAPVMALVEVVAAGSSDPSAVDRAETFARGLGKTTVRCRDAPGFIVNRVNRPYTLEALRIVEARQATVGEIDRAMERVGFPMGPFALMDLVGLDVNYAVARALWAAFDNAVRFEPSPIQERLVKAGHLGRKSGEGFYRYASDGRRLGPVDEFAGPEDSFLGVVGYLLAAFLGGEPAGPRLSTYDIADLIILAILNEAHYALGEGVASTTEIDLALKLGANHPWGPFERTAQLGADVVRKRLSSLEHQYGPRFAPAPLLREQS